MSIIQRSTYVTKIQKRRLIQLLTIHPELLSMKVTSTFNISDSQRLWQSIASECNALPGARKTWKQWRKTFQDLKSKYKRRQRDRNGELPQIAYMLNPAEREVLGIKQSPPSSQQDTEFVNIEQESEFQDMESEDVQEPNSPAEVKVFPKKTKVIPYKTKRIKRRDCNECMLNCNLLALQEEQKIKLKEDYFNFRKDYLMQKLKLMTAQTEALKTIARNLTHESHD